MPCVAGETAWPAHKNLEAARVCQPTGGPSSRITNPSLTMPGVGKLLKQAQKMQRGIESLQAQLEAKEIEVASGGGAVRVRVNGAGRFLALTLDPEFLKEDAKLVADTVLAAVQDAAKQAKDFNDAEMRKVTGAFQMPGLL
jgi:DNA-binding YbaB/EbfC family protein